MSRTILFIAQGPRIVILCSNSNDLMLMIRLVNERERDSPKLQLLSELSPIHLPLLRSFIGSSTPNIKTHQKQQRQLASQDFVNLNAVFVYFYSFCCIFSVLESKFFKKNFCVLLPMADFFREAEGGTLPSIQEGFAPGSRIFCRTKLFTCGGTISWVCFYCYIPCSPAVQHTL